MSTIQSLTGSYPIIMSSNDQLIQSCARLNKYQLPGTIDNVMTGFDVNMLKIVNKKNIVMFYINDISQIEKMKSQVQIKRIVFNNGICFIVIVIVIKNENRIYLTNKFEM